MRRVYSEKHPRPNRKRADLAFLIKKVYICNAMTLAECNPGDGVRIAGEIHLVLSNLSSEVQVRGMRPWSSARLLPANTVCDFICSEKEAAQLYLKSLQPQTNSFQK